MSRWASDRVPVTFWDVTACFAEEDWKLLHEKQKNFYRNIMKEIHQVLFTLGYKIINTGTLLRVIKWEDANYEDVENSKRRTDPGDFTSSHFTDSNPNPDIILRVQHEEEQIYRDTHSSEETEVNGIASGKRIPDPEMFLQIIKWEAETNDHPEQPKIATNYHDSSSSYPFDSSDLVLRIKEEHELWPVDTPDLEKRLEVHSGNIDVTKTENLTVNPRRWDINRKEIIPAEDGSAQCTVLISRPSQNNHMSHICTNHEDSSDGKATSHTCQFCSKAFVKHSRLLTHLGTIHTESNSFVMGYHPSVDCDEASSEEKSCMCTVCKKSFSKPYLLKVHQRIHAGVKPFQCTECKKTFNQSSALKVHLRRHTGEKPYLCTECTKCFPSRPNLHRHQRTHSGEKPYECTECRNTYCQQSELKMHQRIHTGEKPYQCTECEKAFTQRSTLKVHQRVHAGEKPFECHECKKVFCDPSALKLHLRRHTGEKPYWCTDCTKSFLSRPDLRRHQRIHTGEKPYKCSECKKNYSHQSGLKRHQRIHTGEKPYECTKCTVTFRYDSALKAHQAVHTGEKPYLCKVCLRSFSQLSKLIKHHKIHTCEKPHQCTHCKKTYSYQSALKRHLVVHTGEKLYGCALCKKTYSHQSVLKRHQRIHTGEKPYECTECKETFRYDTSLRAHQTVHSGEKP